MVLRQADLLVRRGHRVTVISRGKAPDWYSPEAEFLTLPDLDPAARPPADVTVATYWTTLAPACQSQGEVVHYCQGYEASYSHNGSEHDAIRLAYQTPVPAITVSEHLAELVRRQFRRPARRVLQPLEPEWSPRPAGQPSDPPRILVASPFEIDWKGVATALDAVRHLRQRGVPCRLVRLSQWPLPAEETALLPADEAHIGIPPRQVPDLVRSCDLLLAPSWEAEGFGLPVLEAMASGVPVVASDIACFRGFAAGAAALVPPRDGLAFAAAAGALLDDPERWREGRRAGLAVADAFAEEKAAADAESALRWVASGAWKREAVRSGRES
ncbi:MAG: glycosyltransferase family 4 protein [Acidobacteriota bacterium]